MHLGLNLLLDSTLCSNSSNFLFVCFFKLQNVMAKVTMVLKPFTRHNFKNCECLLSKATGNSDNQNVILETTENTSTWEVEVRK